VNRHRTDFERLAVGTGMNWRDLADLVIETVARDPDAAKPDEDEKACYSRVLFLRNNRTNQIVRQQIFRMIIIIESGDIISAFPHSKQCP